MRENPLSIPAVTIALSLAVLSTAGCGAARRPGPWQKPASSVSYDRPMPEGKQPVTVGFVHTQAEPTDEEVRRMVDDVIRQVYGEKGLRALVKPGDKVVIKVNIAGTNLGPHGDKGRGITTDPRIVRHLAERIREVIGWQEPAGIIVTDGEFHHSSNPSTRDEMLDQSWISFYWARLERTGDDTVDPEDVSYDADRDGILDGTSGAVLVNADAIPPEQRFVTEVDQPTLGRTKVYLPKFLRTKTQANGEAEYCDVFIGVPIFKSHGYMGLTTTLKNHYGLRYRWATRFDTGRKTHSGFSPDEHNQGYTTDINLLADFISAEHRARTYDFSILDAITGNRRGPHAVEYWSHPHNPTDYIFTNALLASTDPVALDTVAALFAGYRLDSIPQLRNSAFNGIGVWWPELIRVAGWDEFSMHRRRLLEELSPAKVADGRAKGYWVGLKNDVWVKTGIGGGFGTYPFAEHGTARLFPREGFFGPSAVELAVRERPGAGGHLLDYRVVDARARKNRLVRIDVRVDGKPTGTSLVDPPEAGSLSVDLSRFRGKEVQVELAVWDDKLNCTRSSARRVSVR